MPLAFFCTLFFRHRKKSVSAPWDGQSQSAPWAGVCACGRTGGFPLAPGPLRIASQSNRAPHGTASPNSRRSRRVKPRRGQGRGLRLRAHWGLSSGQTIGAVRTAVRPACCLPELRVANRLRRLYPLDTRFPPFPPCTPFGSPPKTIEHLLGLQALLPRRSRRVRPHRGRGYAPAGALGAFLWANHRRINPHRGLCLPPSHLPFFLLY